MAATGVWRCRKCRFLNLDMVTCQKCGADIPPKLAKSLEEQGRAGLRYRWEKDDKRHQQDYNAPKLQPQPAAAPSAPSAPSLPVPSSPAPSSPAPTAPAPFSPAPPTLPPNELPPWERPIPRRAVSQASPGGPLVRTPAPGAARRAAKSAVGVILAVLALQVITVVMAQHRHVDASGQLKLGLGLSVAFYGLLGIWASLRAYALDVRVRWLVGPAARSVLAGVARGVIPAVVLALLFAVFAGHPLTDPFVALIASQPAGRLFLGIIVIGLLGPFVEELVFRGFLAEAFRAKGRVIALFVSGLAFAVAHWQPYALPYYLIMGIAFGLTYFRRGLIASFAAHGTFNTSLVVLALFFMHGSPVTYHVDGLAVRLPARWSQVQTVGNDFAALGPSGAVLEIAHINLPTTAHVDMAAVAAALHAGQVQIHLPGGASVDPSTATTVDTPVGNVLRLRTSVYNHPGDGALLVTGSRLVSFVFFGSGSGQAAHDFDAALQNLRFAGLT